MRVVATAAALIILPLLSKVQAKDESSLTDFESRIGSSETQVSESDSNTIGALKEKLLLAETTISALTATVAEMGNSAEASRRELAESQLKLEVLQPTSKADKSSALESRLVECMRDMRALKKNEDSLRNQLLLLSESVQMLLMTTENANPQSRLSVEAELRKANELLATANLSSNNLEPQTLNNGIVIDTKENLSLVVINLGSAHGVKVGMPFQILRSGRVINSIKIVDVRDKISGGVIQSLSFENVSIQKGDQLKVEVQK